MTGPQIATNVKIRIGTEEFISSSGINDSGVFEQGFSQPKYMPFEYLKIDENKDCILTLDKLADFDVTTISDVVLHINYYADPSDDITRLDASVDENNSSLLMSWKYDFPLEWQGSMDDLSHNAPKIQAEHVPYKMRNNDPGFTINRQAEQFFVVLEDEKVVEVTLSTGGNKKLSDAKYSTTINNFTIIGNKLKYQDDNEVLVAVNVIDVWMLYKK